MLFPSCITETPASVDGPKWGKVRDISTWDSSRQKDILPWCVLWASRWSYWDKVPPGIRDDHRELLTISRYRSTAWELYLFFHCNLLEHKRISLCGVHLPFSISTSLRNWFKSFFKRREKERKEKRETLCRMWLRMISILVWFSVPFAPTKFCWSFGACQCYSWPFLSGLGHHVLISVFLLPAYAQSEHQM